jgi:hypothetical protein
VIAMTQVKAAPASPQTECEPLRWAVVEMGQAIVRFAQTYGATHHEVSSMAEARDLMDALARVEIQLDNLAGALALHDAGWPRLTWPTK